MQIDLAAQVERVKGRTRPWKSIIALLLAIAAAVVSDQARYDAPPIFSATNHTTNRFIAVGLALAFLVFGSIATYSLAGKVRQLLHPKPAPPPSPVPAYA